MQLSVELPESIKGNFGLRAFPGKVFAVDVSKSYDDQIVVNILLDGKLMNFSRESLPVLLKQVVPA